MSLGTPGLYRNAMSFHEVLTMIIPNFSTMANVNVNDKIT
jgi:hypothetical protein